MSHIIDRRLNGKHKSAVNRQKFLQRYRLQIKKAVDRIVSRHNMTDIGEDGRVNIPVKDLSEPSFGLGNGGVRESIHPGNTDFMTGDRVERPQSGGSGNGQGSSGDGGGGEDDFVFELSREEFMNFFFSDMELPNLVKTRLMQLTETQKLRAGYRTDGVPSNIDIPRSLRNALGRRLALSGGIRRAICLAETQKGELDPDADDQHQLLEARIGDLQARLKRIPWLDPFDLRYRNLVPRQRPASQAVMFCVMDVSGSMDQPKKDMAKRFFILLYLFLTRTYERIELVFIRHHATAEEVDEERFFNQRETGGTLVSSALELTRDIIHDRYACEDWNIYVAQASDGDNMSEDSPVCRQLLAGEILPLVQYYAYVEITNADPQNLWEEYSRLKETEPNFAMQRIASPADIYPVLRELFKKQPA